MQQTKKKGKAEVEDSLLSLTVLWTSKGQVRGLLPLVPSSPTSPCPLSVVLAAHPDHKLLPQWHDLSPNAELSLWCWQGKPLEEMFVKSGIDKQIYENTFSKFLKRTFLKVHMNLAYF